MGDAWKCKAQGTILKSGIFTIENINVQSEFV